MHLQSFAAFSSIRFFDANLQLFNMLLMNAYDLYYICGFCSCDRGLPTQSSNLLIWPEAVYTPLETHLLSIGKLPSCLLFTLTVPVPEIVWDSEVWIFSAGDTLWESKSINKFHCVSVRLRWSGSCTMGNSANHWLSVILYHFDGNDCSVFGWRECAPELKEHVPGSLLIVAHLRCLPRAKSQMCDCSSVRFYWQFWWGARRDL